MSPIKYCPVCIMQNKKNKLIPRQINFRLTVYLCENNACPYPEGFNSVQIEQRSLNEIPHKQREPLCDESNLDIWLNDFFANEDSTQSVPSNDQIDDGNINDDELTKIINEISNTHNENELDLQYDIDVLEWIDNAFQQNENEPKECEGFSNIADNLNSMYLNAEQINQSTALLGNESLANADLGSTSSINNCNPIKQKDTKLAVINENKFSLVNAHLGNDSLVDICNDKEFSATKTTVYNENNSKLLVKRNDPPNKVSSVNVRLGNMPSVNNCNNRELKPIKSTAVNGNMTKYAKKHDTKENITHKSSSMPYRILNFEQIRRPIEDHTGISRSFNTEYGAEPTKSKYLISVVDQASSPKCIHKKKAAPNFKYYANIKRIICNEDSLNHVSKESG